MKEVEIVLVSSGHQALDSRVFDKEASSLARYFPNVRVVAAHPENERRAGVQITALPTCRNRWERFLLRPLRCYWAARGAGRRLLILHDPELLLWAPFVRLLTGWRLIYDVHEDFSQLLLRRRWISPGLRDIVSRWVGMVEHLCSYACDGVIGVTEVLVESFTHRRRVAIYNLPSRHFAEQAAASVRPPSVRQYDIVHLGTLSEERLDFLCEVLHALHQRRPEAKALVVGARPDQVELLKMRFPDGWVTVMGKVDYAEVAGLLAECRIGLDVHPVLYPHLRCAVPVKVFEYIAAGCNVITSYLPELSRVLAPDGEDHLVVLKAATAEDFAGEIGAMLDDPAAMLRHQAVLLEQLKYRWTWEREEVRFVNFINSLLHDLQWEPSGTCQLPLASVIKKESVSGE